MTDAQGSSKAKGTVLARDLNGTFYIVPVEAMLQYAVNDPKTLTSVTKAWEANERGERGDDVQAYWEGDILWANPVVR
jgi:hypothetical protein